MVLNEASLLAGMMIGNVISGYLYAATNSETVFSISTILIMFSLLYVYLFVVESLKPDQIHSGVNIMKHTLSFVSSLFQLIFLFIVESERIPALRFNQGPCLHLP